MYNRWIEKSFSQNIHAPFVHILFGARQTGKSTLLKKLIPDATLWLDLSDPALRVEYTTHPELFVSQCKAIPKSASPNYIVVDEAQTVPAIFDAVQHLYDNDKSRWRFILCGSSARKMRDSSVNLLPGRSLLYNLYALTMAERPYRDAAAAKYTGIFPLKFSFDHDTPPDKLFPDAGLFERLAYGELPGIVSAPEENRGHLLKTYSLVYIEEEIRREAMIRNLTAFSRFLQFAATESGNMLNYAKIAKDAAVSIPTIKNYFQLLEEMFIVFRIPAFSGSTRKNLLSTERMYFFDLGVRHAAAGIPASKDMVPVNPGPLFEQWVVIELWKRLKYLGNGNMHYLRSASGFEIDCIISLGDKYIPIEIKWTEHPDRHDARHLESFMKRHPKAVDKAFIICRCRLPMEISENIIALPWFCL